MNGRPRKPRAWTTAAAAALALLLLVLASFWPVVSGARSFFHLDLYYEHLPVWAATQRALLAGQSPFWLEGEYCGQPSLFIQEAPLFYPATVPLLATGAPVHRLSDLFTLFHFWLAGFAVFLLVRDLTGKSSAALFGGIAWMLSARMIHSAIWPNAVAVSALIPLGLLGLSRIARGRRRSGVLWAAISGGLALLAARPQTLLAAAPLVAVLGAALLWSAVDHRQALRDTLLAGALALALGAPSLLPTAALLPETSRHAGLSADVEDPQPMAQGRELDMVFLPVDGQARWPETAAYAGLFPLALFASGLALLVRRREPGRREFLACAVGGIAGLILAFGSAGPYRYVSRLPLLRGFRVPERFLFSWSFGLAVGAALALAYWLARTRRPALLAAIAIAGVAGDLAVHARAVAPTAEAQVYAVEPAILPALRARLGPDEAGFPARFASLALTLDPTPDPDPVRLALLRDAGALKGALALRYGLASAYGAGPAMARIEEMLRRPSARNLARAGVGAVVLSGLDASGARSAAAPPVIEPVEALPRSFLVPESLVVPPDDAVPVALSPQIDPRRVAVLEEGAPLARDPDWSEAAAVVRLLSHTPSRVILEARSPSNALLVLLDTHEAGWRATVDGASTPVLRADAAFRAVRLTKGAHRIEFVFVARGVREGAGLAIAGLLGLVLVALRLRPVETKGIAAPGF